MRFILFLFFSIRPFFILRRSSFLSRARYIRPYFINIIEIMAGHVDYANQLSPGGGKNKSSFLNIHKPFHKTLTANSSELKRIRATKLNSPDDDDAAAPHYALRHFNEIKIIVIILVIFRRVRSIYREFVYSYICIMKKRVRRRM